MTDRNSDPANAVGYREHLGKHRLYQAATGSTQRFKEGKHALTLYTRTPQVVICLVTWRFKKRLPYQGKRPSPTVGVSHDLTADTH